MIGDMGVIVLAFVTGVILGGGGAYAIAVRGRYHRDMKAVTEELKIVDGNLRKIDRNSRMFLQDCKTLADSCTGQVEKAAAALDAVSLDLHSKLSVQANLMEGTQAAVQGLADSVPGRFDVLDAAHRETGAEVHQILTRVKELS